ncbi:apolipoprotein N-acyltransferase [uncultured Cytophaga sp.]|uniref:apolipoprotein N-acyltransferase n=1 Tax=uncultured Cytophaga sp. TaxID=160238 RepID=UPI00261982E8|nr:apolipoprotein N-acyltransferase [uncultured Cytophaga sp.]
MPKIFYQQCIKFPYIIYSLISGFSFILAWPTSPFVPFIFISFIPILFLFDAIQASSKKRKGLRFLSYTYLALLIWNIGTTYWVYNSTAAGGIFAIVVNPLLMSIPFAFFYFVRKRTNERIGLISFIIFYLVFEYWHINWQLAWPWLTLGNAFAKSPILVQWYEYTGVFGGSLWILICNVLLYLTIKYTFSKNYLAYTICTIGIPIILSLVIYTTYKETGDEIEVVVVQPNLDPYNEKFSSSPKAVPYEVQFERMIHLSDQVRTPQTRFILWPETALPIDVNEDKVNTHPFVNYLINYTRKNNVSILTGIDSHRFVDALHKTATSRETSDHLYYYDSYNAAMLINPDSSVSIYHKSRMVPGVESLPYPEIFGFVSSSLGGIVQSIGSDTMARALKNNTNISVAPVICYESIFGEYVSEYVTNGANFIGIITNDGWWGNTQGHKQHFQYARLRAIEQRKSIARAANTGTSGFINQRGNVLQENAYWVQDALVQKIKINSIHTFYSKHGDFIGLLALILSPLLFIYSFFSKRHV